MSDISPPVPEGAYQAFPPSAATVAAPRRPRVWPAVVIVALMWATLLIVPRIDVDQVEFLNDFVKFMAQMGAVGLGTLLFLGWWLFFSRVRWKDRLLLLLTAIAVGVMVFFVGAETVGFTLMMKGVPYLLAAWAGWLLVAHSLSWPLQRGGVVAVMVLALGYCALVRWDGLSGEFKEATNWRWAPTREDEYLSYRRAEGGAVMAPLAKASPVVLGRGDWPAFRGPERDSRVPGTHVATDWQTQAPREVWRKKVGPGWGSFAVVDNRLYTQEQWGDKEVVMCWEADTGKAIWAHEDKARFTEPVAGPGPRATPTFHEGKIYTLGGAGTLDCLDAATGKLLWTKDIAAESGRAQLDKSDRAPMWGYSSSPLVTHGVVVVFAGGPQKDPPPGKALLAFDAATGELKWSAGTGGHSYVSAQLAKLQGVEQILITTDAGVFSYSPTTHEELWRFDWDFVDGQRCCQPAVLDDSDFLIGTAMNKGLKRVRVSREGTTWSTKEIWATKAISPYFNDLVVHKGYLYGFDGPFLTCVKLEDGKRRWRVRGYDTGQVLLLADQDLLLVISEQGDVALVAATPDEHRELPGRFHAIDGKTWNHPVVAHGRLYVRNGEEAACYELPQRARSGGGVEKMSMSKSPTSEFKSSAGVVMIRAPAGSFTMGSPESEDGHRVWEQQREVTFVNDFYLGKAPVTQDQYEAVTGTNPTDHEKIGDAPVDSVTWDRAKEYCQKLTKLDREAGVLPDDWEYRLPTEAEWEYACRAGSAAPRHGPPRDVAWHHDNADEKPHAVGQKSPNPWGFHDMLGNVWEWCQDWFSVANTRSVRGGSYFNSARFCRCAQRWGWNPNGRGRYCGFRLLAARAGSFDLSPPIDDFGPQERPPSIFDAIDANDFDLALRVIAADPSAIETVDGIPPPLHDCIYHDKPEWLEWLLDHGADIERREQDYGATPLTAAVVHRQKRIIPILVGRGAKTEGALKRARNGLAGAYEDFFDRKGYQEIVELLQTLGVEE